MGNLRERKRKKDEERKDHCIKNRQIQLFKRRGNQKKRDDN